LECLRFWLVLRRRLDLLYSNAQYVGFLYSLVHLPWHALCCQIRLLFAFFQSLDVHISIIIILSSVAFGLNHLVYSKINVLTKMIWGCMFALLYYYTDNIFYPIFSHVLCNIIVFTIGKVWRQK